MRVALWVASLLLAFGVSALAQDHIRISVGETRGLALTRPMATVIVANEGIVRAEPVASSTQRLNLRGEGKGQTTLTIQDDKGAVFYSAIITVGSPERIITIISKSDTKQLSNAKGIDRLNVIPNIHDEWTYRCDDSRCVRFQQHGQELKRDDPTFPQPEPANLPRLE